MIKALRTVGRYIMLMGRTFSRPERMRMFFRQYPDKIKHRKPMDAPLDGGIRHPRDSST